MKSIENFTVLNTWVLLIHFLNEHWFIVTAASTEIFIRAFMVSWRFCDTDNESADTKRAFKPNFLNFPAIGRKQNFSNRDKFGIKTRTHQIQRRFRKELAFQENIRAWRDIALLVSLIVRKSLEFFVNKPESVLFQPERPTLIFFWLPWNRITLTLNMLNFPILCDLFPFSMFYCANEAKMFKKLITAKRTSEAAL